MQGVAASKMLSLPVRTHGIHLGRPVDLLLDAGGRRVVGLEVLCRDGTHGFLPFSVADIRAEEIAVESTLMLLDERTLEYYRARTRRLADANHAEPWVDERGLVHESRAVA